MFQIARVVGDVIFARRPPQPTGGMSLKTILSKHGTVVSLDWRPGDPIQVKHPSDVPTADILVLEALGNPTRIIYADKAFGRCVEKLAYGLELWDYAETLAMPVDTALAYLKKKSMSYALVYSCNERREKINPKKERALLNKIKSKYEEQTNPYYAAARLWTDAIIDPLETRKWISIGIEAANNAPLEKRFNMGLIQV